ncbi:hypothetical protein CWC21_14775 [Pseudoalteromonas phenolica]|nr:hypothetical protein CWC21_14775 [Pseudoalteromonas phenolica]
MQQQVKKLRSNPIPTKFRPYSTILAQQLDVLFNRSYDKNNNISSVDETAISICRLQNTCLSLYHLLPYALRKVEPDTADAIVKKGLNALLDFETWQELEYVCANGADSIKLPNYATRIEKALENLVRFHLKNNTINAPFRLVNDTISIDLSKLHALNFIHLLEARDLLRKYFNYISSPELNLKAQTIRDNILKSSSAIISLCQSKSFTNSDSFDQPLVTSLGNKELITPFLSNICFHTFVRFLLPDVWGKPLSNPLRNELSVIIYAKTISNKFSEEVASFTKNQLNNVSREQHSKARHLALYFPRWLCSEKQDARPIIEILTKHGISGLSKDNNKGFVYLYDIYLNKTLRNKMNFLKVLNCALDLYHFVTGNKVIKESLLPYSLGYYFKESDTTVWQKHKWLFKNAHKFYHNLVEYHEVFTKRVDGESIGTLTLKSYIGDMASALKKSAPSLTDEQMSLIANNGVHAFVENDFEILKAIREAIQLKSKKGELSVLIGRKLQSVIDRLLSFYGLDTIKGFPVSAEFTARHQVQLSQNQDKVYAYKEVVELAYYIEKGLADTLLATKEKVTLYAAKVLLKTGWNLTPTLELDTNDLIFFNAPLNLSKTPALRLFKRRADYQTQWHKFKINATDLEKEGVLYGDAVTPVIFDIKAVIKLTYPYSPSIKNLSKRIFVFPEMNKIGRVETKILTASRFKTTIDRVLTELGCDLVFNSQKIRKTGLNYIYRKVAKEFKWYQKVGKHSYETFLRHYLMQDNKDVAMTINRATKTMADYFVRDVTDKVIILQNPPEDGKKVPNGTCVNSKDKSAVVAFESQNRKLLDQRDADEQACADFNACLWCPFYRCVADALHVWKLLSYRDFVLADMESSAATFDSVTEQLENIEQLKYRVNGILADIAKLNAQAVIEGKELLKTEGIHPHWK